MGRVTRGRVIRSASAASGERARPAHASASERAKPNADTHRGRVLGRSAVEAHDQARAIIAAATTAAAAIDAQARSEAERMRESVRAELRAEADARIAAALLVVRAEDERSSDRQLSRLADTAVVLAERLLGQVLELEPSRIVGMAQAALSEASGARRVVFEANPLDAAALQAQLHALGLTGDAVAIEAREDLARGDLVLRTDLGTLDARLKPQLQRLADALSRAARAG